MLARTASHASYFRAAMARGDLRFAPLSRTLEDPHVAVQRSARGIRRLSADANPRQGGRLRRPNVAKGRQELRCILAPPTTRITRLARLYFLASAPRIAAGAPGRYSALSLLDFRPKPPRIGRLTHPRPRPFR